MPKPVKSSVDGTEEAGFGEWKEEKLAGLQEWMLDERVYPDSRLVLPSWRVADWEELRVFFCEVGRLTDDVFALNCWTAREDASGNVTHVNACVYKTYSLYWERKESDKE